MKHPAYHLRPNKAIDRILLLKAIETWNKVYDLSSHTYYGFGGPYLDDVRILCQQFLDMRFVSIEKNGNTHKRQRFHQNTKNLTFVHNDVNSYLKQQFKSGTPSIFWLDYTDLKVARFDEFMEVLQLVGNGSVVKITLLAQTDNPAIKVAEELLSGEMATLFRDKWLKDFQQRYGGYLPGTPSTDDLQSPQFVNLLQKMVQIAAQKALPASVGSRFQIVHSCRYSDGPQMLSITGIVCDEDTCQTVRSAFSSWKLSNTDWNHPHHIDVPDLSVKERLMLEKYLPVIKGTGKALQRALGYKIDDSQQASERKLHQYQQFYTHYPLFAKISV